MDVTLTKILVPGYNKCKTIFNAGCTKTDVQIKPAFLQLQGKEVSLNPFTVQKKAILLQSLEVYGNVVLQRTGLFFRILVDH